MLGMLLLDLLLGLMAVGTLPGVPGLAAFVTSHLSCASIHKVLPKSFSSVCTDPWLIRVCLTPAPSTPLPPIQAPGEPPALAMATYDPLLIYFNELIYLN